MLQIKDISLDPTFWLYSSDMTRVLAPNGREVEAETGAPPLWVLLRLSSDSAAWRRSYHDARGGWWEEQGLDYLGIVQVRPDFSAIPIMAPAGMWVRVDGQGTVYLLGPDAKTVRLRLEVSQHGRPEIPMDPRILVFGTPDGRYCAPDSPGPGFSGGGGGAGGGPTTITIPVPR